MKKVAGLVFCTLICTLFSHVAVGQEVKEDERGVRADHPSQIPAGAADQVTRRESNRGVEERGDSSTESHSQNAEHVGNANRNVKSDINEGRGQETSTEMRNRRDERRLIQEQYRQGDDQADPDQIVDDHVDEQGKDKKPWWKFWED